MNKEYIQYLQSQEWRIKKELVLTRENNTCQKCGSTSNLQIHHWTYYRLYREDLNDLYCLCSRCHNFFHKKWWMRDILNKTIKFIKWEEYIQPKNQVKEAIPDWLEEYILKWGSFSNNPFSNSIKIWKRAKKNIKKHSLLL